VLALEGEDLRGLPLTLRKTNLARLLARRPDGIFAAPFEQGEIGPDLFRAACKMGLEGLVSKRRDRPYRAGRSPHWIKNKNRSHPAMSRVMDALSRKEAPTEAASPAERVAHLVKHGCHCVTVIAVVIMLVC
jgi:ATP-dependent DNA ligase